MEYKIGDKVKIKSLDWYNQNKDENGFVHCGDRVFDNYMSVFCGSVVTICGVGIYGYGIQEDMHCRTWAEDMFEGLADEEPQEKMVSLDKVIKWLQGNTVKNFDNKNLTMLFGSTIEMIEDFRKTMEE